MKTYTDEELKELDRKTGEKWRHNSSLEEWFPFTAEELQRLRAENEALKRDAERYRWLRNEQNDVAMVIDKRTGYVPPDDTVPYVAGHYTYEYRANAELDEAIDRAMKG